MLPDRTKSRLSTLYTRRQLHAALRVRDFFDNCAAKVSLRALTFGLTLSLTPAMLLGQTAIPNTPAGSALRAWLDAYNSGDSARAAAFLRTYQVDFPIRNAFPLGPNVASEALRIDRVTA